jgi:ABC-type sugar transport system substrate-binding protein
MATVASFGMLADTASASGSKLSLATVTPEVENVAQIDQEVEAFINPGATSLAAVKALVAKEKKVDPTKWAGPTAPDPAPKGHLKIGLMSCDAALLGCVTPLDGVQQAAKVLGWSTKVYDGGGSAATENADILNMISSGDNAILYTSINPATIQQGLTAAKKAGIPVIASSSGSDTPNPVVETPKGQIWPIVDVSQNFVETGRIQADWVIGDSNGNANVLLMTDKEYTSGVSMVGEAAEFEKRCPGCTLSTFNFAGSTVGTPLATQLVGYLRSHSSVQYVMMPYDPAAAAVVPALAQAGMTKIKICSNLGDAQNLAFIKAGEVQACDGAYDNVYAGWAMTDQLIRALDKLPEATPHGENVPQILLDKTNSPAGNGGWATPFNYRADYEKLWSVK